MKQVESILREVERDCPVNADDATRGRIAAMALKRIARHGIALGDEQVLARVAARFSRDVGNMAVDTAQRAIKKAMAR